MNEEKNEIVDTETTPVEAAEVETTQATPIVMHTITLQQHLEQWIGENTEKCKMAQALARFVIDNNLMDDMRRIPFEIQPFEDAFEVGVHLDHPMLGHWWIRIITAEVITFTPWVPYWYDIKTVNTLEDAQDYILQLAKCDGAYDEAQVKAELELFNNVKFFTDQRRLQALNKELDFMLSEYHRWIDPELELLKADLEGVQNLIIENPHDGAEVEWNRIAGKNDLLLLAEPCLLTVREGVPGTEEFKIVNDADTLVVHERVNEFRREETKRSASIYAAQKYAATHNYTVEVCNESPLAGRPGLFVQVDEDGNAHIRYILLAKYIVAHSPLEIAGSGKWMV